MFSRSRSSRPWRALFVGGFLLAAAPLTAVGQAPAPAAAPEAPPASPQQPKLGQGPQAPPAGQPPAPEQPAEPPTQEPTAQQAAAAPGATGGFSTANLEGDQFAGQFILPSQRVAPSAPAKAAVPATRSFKIAEDENPRPQDRVYFNFNYYNDVNGAVNDALHSPIHSIEAYRYTFGLEKTFLDGDLSLGLRLPLNNISSESDVAGFGGTTTALGDLAIILKGVLWTDQESGNLLSAGLAVTPPTGPSTFANTNIFTPVHDTLLTPFVGYILKADRAYVQGFTSIDVPTGRDVVLLHNDVQFGYFLLRNTDQEAFLTAVVPLVEVHVNDPLNHRGATNPLDPLGTQDVVDVTSGITFEMKGRATLAFGVVTPVTGPKPFDVEALAQLNIRFGAAGRQPGQLPPPGPLGQ